MVDSHVTIRNPYIGHTLRVLRERRRAVGDFIRLSEVIVGPFGTDHHYPDVAHQIDLCRESLDDIDQAIKLTTAYYYADCPCPEIPVMGMGEVSYYASCNCKPPPEDYRLPNGFLPEQDDLPF